MSSTHPVWLLDVDGVINGLDLNPKTPGVKYGRAKGGSFEWTMHWRTEVIDGPEFSAAHAGERSMVIVATQGHYD